MKTYMATIQILISPEEKLQSESEACDWFSGLLSENEKILDWSYLKIGGQYLSPSEKYVSEKDYEEGEIFINT